MAAAAMALFGCGGGDDAACGPGDPAMYEGITGAALSGDPVTIAWEGFTSGPNNDCTPDDGGATSLTIQGTQPESGFAITFCVPRPDTIGGDPVALVYASEEHPGPVEVVDMSAMLDGDCILTKDPDTAPSGTVTFIGLCGDGIDPAGYAISVDANVAGLMACAGGAPEAVTITLSGATAVVAQ